MFVLLVDALVVFVSKFHGDVGDSRFLGVRAADTFVVGVGGWHDNHSVATEGGFGNEEYDREHENAEEYSANAEGPAVTVEFDNVPGNESAAADAGEQKEVPDCDSSSPFVDEV